MNAIAHPGRLVSNLPPPPVPVQPDIFTQNAAFRGDLLRNIPGIRTLQHLFDDLSA